MQITLTCYKYREPLKIKEHNIRIFSFKNKIGTKAEPYWKNMLERHHNQFGRTKT